MFSFEVYGAFIVYSVKGYLSLKVFVFSVEGYQFLKEYCEGGWDGGGYVQLIVARKAVYRNYL